MKTHNKLVRDKIPEILDAKGIGYDIHIADKTEYEDKLYLKLREELNEFILNPCAEEIADMLEVIESIGRFHGIKLDEIRKAKIGKKYERGGFNNKIILETTDDGDEPVIERDGSHVHLKMGDTGLLRKDFKTSGQK